MNNKQQVIELLLSEFPNDAVPDQLADKIDAIYRSEGMITREQIKNKVSANLPQGHWMDGSVVNNMTDPIMELIRAEREQYAELVEAAVAYQLAPCGDAKTVEAFEQLTMAVQPFLPPPSILDRLDMQVEI